MKRQPIDDGNLKYIATELAPWLRAMGSQGLDGSNGMQTAADWLVRLVDEMRHLRKTINKLEARQ